MAEGFEVAGGADAEVAAPSGMRAPGRVMLLGLAATGLAFASTLPEWISADVTTVMGSETLSVAGSDASSAVSALALVAVVACIVVRIAAPVVRWVICALMAAAGVGMAVATWAVIQYPGQAALAVTSAVTGTTDTGGAYRVSVWPWVTVLSSCLVVLVAGWAAWASRTWPVKRKYDRGSLADSGEDLDEIDTWDSLSNGQDPTDRD